ncbi:MAG TPA: YqgE/AlgH family protein, partial [Chitinophagaceae bacterium]|nr:YqgE/AlgH family protein [Chitinophagaceae bacterium]
VQGTLLIADPFLKDPNFMRTVIFICEHQPEGSFGFVLNRAYEHTLDELISGAEGMDIPVFTGGPVQMDTIHFLHRYPDLIPGGLEVIEGVYWGGSFEKALELIRSGEIDRQYIRFYIGYSGWGEGQLEEELKDKSWLLTEANRSIVFHQPTAEIWKEALRLMGGDYAMMVNFPIDPRLN